MSKLIFGGGYLGQRVARLWRDAGETVFIVTRSEQRAVLLAEEGYEAIVADVTNLDTLLGLPILDTVLFAVGFDRNSQNTIHEVYANGVKNVLTAMSPFNFRLIYISTTGVYGPADGDWVDETTAPNPQRDGGRASLAAEQQLGPNNIILRFAGIYGPERIPYLAKLRAGEPIAAPSQGWLNLIHVDDGAKIVLAAEAWAQTKASLNQSSNIFNVSDGHPVIRGDYYREVATRIGAPPPQFSTPDPNSPAAARAASDKRITNAKLLQAFDYQFTYPSYRAGLAQILG